MVKWSLSQREIPRAMPEEFSEGSGFISPYIPNIPVVSGPHVRKKGAPKMLAGPGGRAESDGDRTYFVVWHKPKSGLRRSREGPVGS